MKALEKLAKKDKTNFVTKKDGTLKQQASFAISGILIQVERNNGKVHYNYYQGRGKWTTIGSYYSELTAILKILGYKWTEGNDAPLGGKIGNYIKISKQAAKTLNELH